MRSNRPEFAKQVQPGDIIVGGQNFGCGSSRAATRNLLTLRIGCVLAESIARIFFRNSINLGFPVLTTPGITGFCHEGDILHVDFNTGEIRNLKTGRVMNAEPLPEDSPPMQLLQAGGMMAILEKEYLEKD
jgi:3-isopropylmalate/(R)-2-methylmalate dehydratase small subunit